MGVEVDPEGDLLPLGQGDEVLTEFVVVGTARIFGADGDASSSEACPFPTAPMSTARNSRVAGGRPAAAPWPTSSQTLKKRWVVTAGGTP
jgi:hypothetical protein